jgi:hypothetical protein
MLTVCHTHLLGRARVYRLARVCDRCGHDPQHVEWPWYGIHSGLECSQPFLEPRTRAMCARRGRVCRLKVCVPSTFLPITAPAAFYPSRHQDNLRSRDETRLPFARSRTLPFFLRTFCSLCCSRIFFLHIPQCPRVLCTGHMSWSASASTCTTRSVFCRKVPLLFLARPPVFLFPANPEITTTRDSCPSSEPLRPTKQGDSRL